MKFGIYFYPWYNRQRWREAPRQHTPLIGEYDSTSSSVIKWQMDLIEWCGFDYVVFEIVPLVDWCFETVIKAIEGAVSDLKSRGLGWSFLIDAKSLPEEVSPLGQMTALVESIETNGWDDGLEAGPSGKPLLFAFAPLPIHAEGLLERFSRYEFRFPIWLPHWGEPDDVFLNPIHRPFAEEATRQGVTIFDSLVAKGYVSFWQSTEQSRSYDGFCSVIPGYDDALLKRTPQLASQVAHEGGDTLVQQFQRAFEENADHVLVYGWNEYFETTNIEPTQEYGMLYAGLAQRLIDEARQRQ